MPLYEYQCNDCESQVELLIRSQEETPECPDCGSTRLMRLLSVPTAHTSGNSSDSGGSEELGPGPFGPCGGPCGCFPEG